MLVGAGEVQPRAGDPVRGPVVGGPGSGPREDAVAPVGGERRAGGGVRRDPGLLLDFEMREAVAARESQKCRLETTL